MAWIGWRFFGQISVVEIEQDKTGSAAGCCNAEPLNDLYIQKVESAKLVEIASPDFSNVRPKISVSYVLPVLVFLLVVITVIGVTLHFDSLHALTPLIEKQYSQAAHIQGTLTEAALEPPSELPPEMFLSANQARPGLATADRDWSRLDPAFAQVVLRLMQKMSERGFNLALLEGYRSPERQDELLAQSRVVTKAKGGQSKHQYGLAVDLAPVKDGKIIISERDEWAAKAYEALGEEAQTAGLVWGGDWSFKDLGHVEMAGSLSELQKKK